MTRAAILFWTIAPLLLVGCNSSGGSGGGGTTAGAEDTTDDTEQSGGQETTDDQDTATGGPGPDGTTDGMGDAEPDCAEVTYQSFAQDFFASYCTRCHNSTRSGADRNGAPPGRNWDDLDSVMEHLALIRTRAVERQNMPPSAPFPGEQERQTLGVWIDCGGPVD